MLLDDGTIYETYFKDGMPDGSARVINKWCLYEGNLNALDIPPKSKLRYFNDQGHFIGE